VCPVENHRGIYHRCPGPNLHEDKLIQEHDNRQRRVPLLGETILIPCFNTLGAWFAVNDQGDHRGQQSHLAGQHCVVRRLNFPTDLVDFEEQSKRTGFSHGGTESLGEAFGIGSVFSEGHQVHATI
jgi:hypothetical protein